MLKPLGLRIHSGSQKIDKLILSSIENQERKIIELIQPNTKQYRYETERLRNILRLRGYSKRFIASAFEGRHLAKTSTGLALIPSCGDITSVAILEQDFVLSTSANAGVNNA
ncbi:hypothetical protein [Nostoc sp. CALU 1950]|uniref:hypothetical protein n=1 Tax=Nostoc sp. CALU 1950 TaxID=3104321 RepID=UPI003EBF0EB3